MFSITFFKYYYLYSKISLSRNTYNFENILSSLAIRGNELHIKFIFMVMCFLIH